jgi:hypothetical protein
MKMRRIFTGTIVALLLSVSPLAVACDLSCAFASMNSDCHAQRAETQDAASGGMRMDGMAMDGITMRGMAHSPEQKAASAISGVMPNHPSIGEMGPCEKQSCDGDTAVSEKTRRSLPTQHNLILRIAENPRLISAARLIRDARDDIATHHIRDGSPLHLSLRI